MDIRSEFNEMLERDGHYILIVHSNKKMRCSCWNDVTNEASKTCPICFGVGYSLLTEKVICREKYLGMSESQSKSLVFNDYGYDTNGARGFYLKHDTVVEAKDLIVNCQFDRHKMPLLSDYRIYEVAFVERFRGDGGKIEYIRAACNLDTVNAKIIATNIRQSGNRDIYNLGMRRYDNE